MKSSCRYRNWLQTATETLRLPSRVIRGLLFATCIDFVPAYEGTKTPLLGAARTGKVPFRPGRLYAPPPIPLVPLPTSAFPWNISTVTFCAWCLFARMKNALSDSLISVLSHSCIRHDSFSKTRYGWVQAKFQTSVDCSSVLKLRKRNHELNEHDVLDLPCRV